MIIVQNLINKHKYKKKKNSLNNLKNNINKLINSLEFIITQSNQLTQT